MEEISFRPAVAADKPAILDIAARTWDGEDYLPDVIDDWLRPGPAQLIAATIEDRLVGLARYVPMYPGFAWLEGLRVDPQHRGHGIAKALTARLVEMADAAGAEVTALSTYFDNVASQKVSAAFGFKPAVGFAFCEGKPEAALSHAVKSSRVVDVPRDEAARFILASELLAAGGGYLPHSWRFYPFARGPQVALSHMDHALGIRDGGRLVALLCLGDRSPHGEMSMSIDFLEGEPDAMVELARHALTLARDEKYYEAMIPCRDGAALPSAEVLLRLGFNVWNERKPDVFVFERRANQSSQDG